MSLSCFSSVHRSYNGLFVSERLKFHTHFLCVGHRTFCGWRSQLCSVNSVMFGWERGGSWNGRGISWWWRNYRCCAGIFLNGLSLTTKICHLAVDWETAEYFRTWSDVLRVHSGVTKETQNMTRLLENLKISLVISVPFWHITQRYRVLAKRYLSSCLLLCQYSYRIFIDGEDLIMKSKILCVRCYLTG